MDSESLAALNEQYLNDEDYLSLVKTNLTLENCSMLTSGLFSIGIEGHFAGPALDGGRWNSWDFYAQGWRELAGTAYPVQLNLKGKVSIYDWKVLENIDSSSLMEGNLFDIDMSNMIKSVGQKDEFSDIITKVDNQNYVHSGIAVFGGGKNYGIISMDGQIEEFANYRETITNIITSLNQRKDKPGQNLQWMNLGYNEETVWYVKEFASMVRNRFENILVLGIGGSALGGIAVTEALLKPYWNLLTKEQRNNLPRIFFLDNIDPDTMNGLLEVIDLKKTLVNVITKSGDTAETMAQFMVIRDLMQKELGDDYRKHIVATTDKKTGTALKAL